MNCDNFSVLPFDVKSDCANLASNWNRWLRSFSYMVQGRAIAAVDQKRALLLHLAGPDVQDLYETLVALEGEEGKNAYDITVGRLNNYFAPKSSKTFERHLFRKIIQQAGETCDQFLTRLRQQAAKCEFVDKDEQIKGQFIDGCSDKLLRRRILEKGEAELQVVVQLARSCELSTIQETSYNQYVGDTKHELISRITRSTNQRKREATKHFPSNFVAGQRNKRELRCFRCNQIGHLAKDQICPAKNKKCHKCQRIGHFATVCKTKVDNKSGKNVRHISSDAIDDSDYLFTLGKSTVTTVCKLGGVDCEFLIDSGASVNVIDESTWKYLKDRKIKCVTKNSKGPVKAFGGRTIPILGSLETMIERNGKTVMAEFVVFKGKSPAILSCQTSEDLELISFNINQLSSAGNDPIIGYKAKIPIDSTCQLPFHKARPIAYGLEKDVKNRLDEMVAKGIIQKVDSAANASPIVVVKKKSGGVRICGDYKVSLNRHVQQVPTQNLNINDILQKIGGMTMFSRIDLEGAYLQIALDEESKPLTTINTPYGLYQYERLPYGIACSPGLFESCMLQILSGLPGVISYMDDVLVMGKDKCDHERNLQQLLARLAQHNVCINQQKSEFYKTEIDFLGHIISGRGLSPNRVAINTIVSARYPKTKKELQSWLGSLQFYNKFLQNLADKVAPLYQLLKQNVPFIFSTVERKAIDSIKKALVSPLLLQPFQPDQPITLTCDASQHGVAATLEQNGKPVMAVSKVLSAAEQKYSQIEREALAIVWSVKKLTKFLLHKKFTLITDHKPLLYIFNKTKAINAITAARLQRWALTLMAYDFDIRYSRSENMHLADLLSRCGTSGKNEPDMDINMIWQTPMPEIRVKFKSNHGARKMENS